MSDRREDVEGWFCCGVQDELGRRASATDLSDVGMERTRANELLLT